MLRSAYVPPGSHPHGLQDILLFYVPPLGLQENLLSYVPLGSPPRGLQDILMTMSIKEVLHMGYKTSCCPMSVQVVIHMGYKTKQT